MSMKAIRRQLIAAVAMLLVSAIALGSSTFAWFVSNNSVKATTSTISAQSNSAFMYIRDILEASTDLTADTSSVENTALYPAHWVTTADTQVSEGKYATATVANFYTATGTSAGDGTMVASSLAKVHDPVAGETTTADGSMASAIAGKYAVKNTFLVGSKGTELSDLIVASASFTGADGNASTSTNTSLDAALRVLVTCGDNWVLCSQGGILAANAGNTANKLADTVSATETTVEIYVFYDGDDAKVYTNNLADLKVASKRITVEFTATPGVTQTGA